MSNSDAGSFSRPPARCALRWSVLSTAWLVASCASCGPDIGVAGTEDTAARCTDHGDNDGDGHVDCSDPDCAGLSICMAFPGGAESEGGFDAGRAEVCENGLDDDGNGQVDEGCSCTPGSTQPCYPGDPATAGRGACRHGRQICQPADELGGQWDPCLGAVVPALEACDGVDNDCDGTVDGLTRLCYGGPPATQGVGLCASGTQTCIAGSFGACAGEVVPAAETCDGRDNDCDGTVDGATGACYAGPPATRNVGLCREGTQSCVGGVPTACQGEVLPGVEVCDNQDNDCDGVVDGISRSCYAGPAGTAGVGLCRAGVQTCVGGAFQACTGEVVPAAEVCDNQDNDCDGRVDGVSRYCYGGPAGTQGVGQCKAGTQTCTAGTFSPCAGEVRPSAEQCDNQDNDCDGRVDGITRPCYSGPAGTQNVGVCREGAQTCSFGSYGACAGEVLPQTERCDGADNDCNGSVDDMPAGQTCTIVQMNLNINGDCVTAQCPPQAPYPIGCNITMQGGDTRGCVASTPTSAVVYFQEGDKCGVGNVSGTLTCASQPGAPLDATNCPINKPTRYYPSSSSGCPATN